MYDVIALGELLIDFTQNAISEQGNIMYEANPGGAPCNVLSMLQKLGRRTAFIGKVGNDRFGELLRQAACEVGIDTECLYTDFNNPTTLAFVSNREDGDRSFSFYRKNGADTMLTKEEIPVEKIKSSRIFHFGSLSMTAEPCKSATEYAVEAAKNGGCLISFDPNLRPLLWDSLDTAKKRIEYGISVCDILKIADDELQWITQENDIDKAIESFRNSYDVPLMLLSMGKNGSRAFCGSLSAFAPAFLTSATIETTGAGDTFCACALDFVLKNGGLEFTVEALSEMLRFSNAAAAIVTTRRGALRVMPSLSEIESLISLP